MSRAKWVRVCSGVGLLLVAAAALAPRVLGGGWRRQAAPEEQRFGSAQSVLEEFQGRPLLVANWKGRFRPYVLRDTLELLFDDDRIRTALEMPEVDLMDPVPLSDHEVLFAATTGGRPDFDVVLYDSAAGTLSNLTGTPRLDEGGTCVHEGTRLISFADGTRQSFAALAPRAARSASTLSFRRTVGSAPPFTRCLFVDAATLIGVRQRERELYRCHVRETVSCSRLPVLMDAVWVGSLFRSPATGGAGIIALTPGSRFRRPFFFTRGYDSLEPGPGAGRLQGDVVDVHETYERLGLHARYQLVGHEDPRVVVAKSRRIGSQLFGVVATARSGRTLALWEHGRWRALGVPQPGAGDAAGAPLEVWLRSDDGRVHQAFYFGGGDARKVVLWWHGGPRENVSPRFNPYFYALNRRGYGVLAVNYPGSTGRGREYEELFDTEPGAVRAAVAAALRYLHENGVEEVISWSVSAGVAPQTHVAAEALGLRAVVDQVGGTADELRRTVEERGIPYFDIRGEHDRKGGAEGARFVYPGGHDLTMPEHFGDLLEALDAFLGTLPEVRFQGAEDGSGPPDVILDPGHVGNAADPNRVGGISEAELTFELARRLADRCLGGMSVRLSRTGNPMLESPAATLRRRRRMASRSPEVPFLSLHFNARSPGTAYPNSSSVFYGFGSSGLNLEIARRLSGSLRAAGVPPQEEYGPELESKLVRVEAGVFERGLALLQPPHRAPRLLLEAAYYDDPGEHGRLARVEAGPEGEAVRPRLRQLADALCPAVRALGRTGPGRRLAGPT
jgi:N-acetylmuramoyl-L-alanine amidase